LLSLEKVFIYLTELFCFSYLEFRILPINKSHPLKGFYVLVITEGCYDRESEILLYIISKNVLNFLFPCVYAMFDHFVSVQIGNKSIWWNVETKIKPYPLLFGTVELIKEEIEGIESIAGDWNCVLILDAVNCVFPVNCKSSLVTLGSVGEGGNGEVAWWTNWEVESAFVEHRILVETGIILWLFPSFSVLFGKGHAYESLRVGEDVRVHVLMSVDHNDVLRRVYARVVDEVVAEGKVLRSPQRPVLVVVFLLI